MTPVLRELSGYCVESRLWGKGGRPWLVQVRDAGHADQKGSTGAGKRRSNSGHNLKAELTGFMESLNVEDGNGREESG